MKKLNKYISMLLCASVIAVGLCSCNANAGNSNSIFGRFDWLGRIISNECNETINGKLSKIINSYLNKETTEKEINKEEQEKDSEENKSSEQKRQSEFEAYAQQILSLCNTERQKYGLKPFTLDKSLCDGALLKSEDMRKNNYFDHTSPNYGSPFDMMSSLGISYRYAGENIAYGYTDALSVMRGWMNSEWHRENILNSKYTKLGVGYVREGNYWTQWFTN